ncbi:MAG: ABC transporter ATP-binding protein [Gammaproteobacteria bacterium]
MALISTHQLTVGSRLKNASVELHAGEVLGLIGPNGAGKSTLLNALAGIVESEGEIRINDRAADSLDSKHRAQLVGLLPQAVNSAWSINVTDVVELGRLPWGDSDATAIQQAIESAGIQEFSQRKIDTLSGGERARVWLARVLAGQPTILLADEPIANLDIHYQIAVMDVLKQYADENHSVIVAIHDLSLAARYCDRLCLMNQGVIIATGTPEEVLKPKLLTDTFGIAVDVNLTHNPPIVFPL